MSPFKLNNSFLFRTFSTLFLFSNIITLPIDEVSLYNKFIDVLVNNNCTLPQEIKLPFSSVPERDQSFSYLSSPLSECRISNNEVAKEEAKFLCNEIFDVFRNITCTVYSTKLPEINITLSEKVCNDFKTMQNIFTKKEEYLSGKLWDGILCKVLCSGDYEQLCKTLLWSYSVQAKIKSSVENNMKTDEKESMDENKTDTTNIKNSVVRDKQNSDEQANLGATDKKVSTSTKDVKTSQAISNLNEKISTAGNTLANPGQTISNLTTVFTNATNMKTPNDSKVSFIPKNVSDSNSERTLNTDNTVLAQSTQNLSLKATDQQNEVGMNANAKNVKKVPNIPTNSETNTNSLTPETSTAPDANKNPTSSNLPNQEKKTDVNSNTDTKADGNSNNFVNLNNEDNELSNVDIEADGDKAVKGKETNVKIGEKDKEIEKPSLADFEPPLGPSDIDSKPLEPTVSPVLPDRDEDIEHQDEKDQEQYKNSFNPPPKNKESSAKNSAVENSNQMTNSYDTFLSSKVRNNFGHVSDDVQVIPSFPEQEDSHFFFYFLSIVLILMAGYLIFHNKQKIIALIVEGRHERRRRSHGAGYKKLETK